ncbi:hypothetical protein C7S14_1804 [Burkholderia cepacia]|nr:hypothetical protein C7S14_1804 [Burkholderia cepacia]
MCGMRAPARAHFQPPDYAGFRHEAIAGIDAMRAVVCRDFDPGDRRPPAEERRQDSE